MTNVVKLGPRTYAAKSFEVRDFGLGFLMSGTLDGYIDFCITEISGRHTTYQLTCDGARLLIAALHGVTQDIQANCLFDRDQLLEPP